MVSIQFIFVLFIVSMVCSKEWYVSKLGSDKNPRSKNEPFYTIQHALSKSSNGDSIPIEAGAYKEDLKLTKSIKLFGISVRGVKPHLYGHLVIGKVKEFSLSNIHIDCSKGDEIDFIKNLYLMNTITKGLVEGDNELKMSNVAVNATKYCYSENECGFSIFKTKEFHLSNCSV
eukprot:gene541-8053_t